MIIYILKKIIGSANLSCLSEGFGRRNSQSNIYFKHIHNKSELYKYMIKVINFFFFFFFFFFFYFFFFIFYYLLFIYLFIFIFYFFLFLF